MHDLLYFQGDRDLNYVYVSSEEECVQHDDVRCCVLCVVCERERFKEMADMMYMGMDCIGIWKINIIAWKK